MDSSLPPHTRAWSWLMFLTDETPFRMHERCAGARLRQLVCIRRYMKSITHKSLASLVLAMSSDLPMGLSVLVPAPAASDQLGQ
jgi:hypothetical protein